MIEIETYKELNKVLEEFKKGTFDFIIIIGNAGIGKTHNVREILGENICYINSHSTILGLYQQAFEKLNKPIWFDDVEGLLEKDNMVGLLKQLCETNDIKKVQYNTSWDLELSRNLPREYETKSKVIMTSNSITRLQNKGVQSLLDRAVIIYFVPTKEEIINYIKRNLKKIYEQEIIDYLGNKYCSFSLRDYIKTSQLKKAGLIKIN